MDSYRYGFQNQEKDDEIKGAGNSVNYTFRMHDPRVGRFFAVDPMFRNFPWNSSYAFSENSTIAFIELEGLVKVVYYWNYDSKTKSMIAMKDKNGDQIRSIIQDGSKDYHTISGVFIDGKYEEFNGDVKNAIFELNKRGKKTETLIYDDLDAIGEMWDRFKNSIHGKNFTQTMENVFTVASITFTLGSSGGFALMTKFEKGVTLLELGFNLDDLTKNEEDETLLESTMNENCKIMYSSFKLALSVYSKSKAVMELNKDKIDLKDFVEYLNANYSVVDGSLDLKEKVDNKKKSEKSKKQK